MRPVAALTPQTTSPERFAAPSRTHGSPTRSPTTQRSPGRGRYTKIFENRLNLRFSDEQREQVIQEGVSLTRSIALPTGSHQLHVVLRDVTTSATGSLRIPLR
jgi:hypothetical protein